MTKSENSSMIILSTEHRGISPHAFPANDCDKESRLEEQTAAGRTAYAPETGGYFPTDADAEFSKRFEDDT